MNNSANNSGSNSNYVVRVNNDKEEDVMQDIVRGIKIFFFIIGISGNIFCLIIWMKKRFLQMPRSTTCLTLAIVNQGFLLIQATNSIMLGSFSSDINLFRLDDSGVSCRITLFFFGLFQHLDSWMIVTLTLERLVATTMVYTSKTYLTRRNLSICVAIIVLIFVVFDCYMSIEIVEFVILKSGRKICRVGAGWMRKLRTTLFGLVPLIVMIPANMIIVGKVLYQRRKLKVANAKVKGEDKRALNVTKMVLSVTLTYIALTLPFSIYQTCCNPSGKGQLSGNLAIMITLPTINASINFYMYFLSAKIFRNEVRHQISQIILHFGCRKCANNLIVPLDGSTLATGSTGTDQSVKKVSTVTEAEA